MKKMILAATVICMLFAAIIVAQASPYEIAAECTVEDFGHTVQTFKIYDVPEAAVNVKAEDFIISNDIITPVEKIQGTEDVIAVSYDNGTLTLSVSPFRYTASDFAVSYVGDEDLNLSFTKEQVSTVNTAVADDFNAFEGKSLVYRLYMPEGDGPYPLVLWTHGGGEKGTDNWLQIGANRGATGWVEYNKDVIVLAPQVQQWGDEELAEVRQIILDLIASGKVDTNRIYGSGCSFGGAGIIFNAAYNSDLFTAILPLCPSNNEDSFNAFASLGDVKAWIYTAFSDTRPTRHLEWMSQVLAQQNAGNMNIDITLLLPEEYAIYGLGLAASEADQRTEYHHTWVLVMRNVRGALDWLFAQSK